MRCKQAIISLSLLVSLSLALSHDQTQDQDQTQPQRGALSRGRRRPGQGLGQRRGRPRERHQHHHDSSQALIRLGSLPANQVGDDGASIFIESYKSINQQQSNYNVIPGKQGQCVYQDITMFDKAVWSPKPCITCLCSNGQVLCDEVICPIMHCHFPFIPTGECCPVCMDTVPDVPDFSGDSAVPNDPSDPDPDHSDPGFDPVLQPGGPLTQAQIDQILRREEEEHCKEEERLLKKDAERKRRKQQKKEEMEKQRKLEWDRRRAEEELLKVKMDKEDEERRQKEEERRQVEEDRRKKEAAEAAARAKERELEEERMKQEMELKEKLRLLEWDDDEEEQPEEEQEEEEQEEEETVWLRGDVFQMSPRQPTEEGVPRLIQPAEEEDEEEEEGEDEGVEEEEEEEDVGVEVILTRADFNLPPGCDISDVTVTCENARLTNFPALSIPELKSLSLEDNSISTIPVGAFNGIPNLEWINLGKNKLTSAGIAPQVFRSLKQLSRLYLDGNLLEQVPADLPPTLQELKINENQLKGIDDNSFQDLRNLVTLELEGNVLSEGNVDPLGFTPLTQLNYLRLGRNHFRTLPQGLPSSLLELYLENNLIEEISESVLNHTTNLNVIILRHNRLDESKIAPLAWINHKNLESIDLSYNQLYLVPSYLPRPLVHLVLVGNQIERIPGWVFAHMYPGIEYLYLSYNKLDRDGVEPESFFGSYNSMVELCLDHNQLVTVPPGINEMRTLHFLRLNNNKIRNFAMDAICDPLNNEDSSLVAVRLENNFIDPRRISPTAFSCVRSYSSVVLKPQRVK